MHDIVKKILRDNAVVNFGVRNFLRVALNRFNIFKSIANRYRVFGNVDLKINGVKFKFFTQADDFIANEIYYDKLYEADEFLLLQSLLSESNYFIDVGANTGIFSIYAAKLNSRMQVISFEPHPGNFARLSKNVHINDLKNIITIPNALGEVEETIAFTVPADMSISTTASANDEFTRNFHSIEFTSVPVKQVKLDDALAGFPISSRDVMKIDVEYYEMNVLRGASLLIKNSRPIIIIEILQFRSLVEQFPGMKNRISETHALEIFSLLRQHDYHAYRINKDEIINIESIESSANRNFLFLPFKLGLPQYSFLELSRALSQAESVD
jgi:FkbM family methyltransferase